MKIKNTLLVVVSIFLLSSCVIKSLNPFYTKKSISFDKRFLGEWKDSKKGTWKVVSFEAEITLENPVEKMNKDDLKLYKEYKNSYYIQREYKGEETLYLATPFKIKNQTFLDFYPLDFNEGVDNLLDKHLVYTHSLVKYDVEKNGTISVKWLEESKIDKLFKEKKIKIKHEKTGAFDDGILLTASSNELQKFIKKYMDSKDETKWNTSTKFTLTPLNNEK